MKIITGEKYYKTETGEIVRVLVDSNPNMIKCSMGNSLQRLKLRPDELEKDYVRLIPHATITFSIVKVQDMEDVIITVYRREDMEKKETLPYIVCRQSITDLFANTINPDYKNLITGFCASKESLPEKVPMENILACDTIISSDVVAVYMNDNFKDIMKLIRSKAYDIVLYNLFVDHVNYKYKDNVKEYMNKSCVDGYVKTLKDLLTDNEFMYEFNRGFGIYPLTLTVSNDEIKDKKLNAYNSMIISNLILRKITSTLLIPYEHVIDTDIIENDHILFKDNSGRLFILLYTWSEEIPIDVGSIESEENISKLANIPGYATNKNILNAIQFNTAKYNK